MVLTYSENTDQYRESPPKDLRMKNAPDIRSISPTNFIPIKSAGKHESVDVFAQHDSLYHTGNLQIYLLL